MSQAITAAAEKERVLAGQQVPGVDLQGQTPTPRALGQLRITREMHLTRLLAQQAHVRTVSDYVCVCVCVNVS